MAFPASTTACQLPTTGSSHRPTAASIELVTSETMSRKPTARIMPNAIRRARTSVNHRSRAATREDRQLECAGRSACRHQEGDDGIWIVSFVHYDLGYIDLEQKTLQPLDNPFGAGSLPKSWVRSVDHVSGPYTNRWRARQDSNPRPPGS